MDFNLSIKNFSNNVKLNTEQIQKAIDECASFGGGKIFFPKGEITIATVFIKSNVHIVLDEQTKILGSLNFDDYERDEKVDYPLYQDASHSFFNCSMFVAKNCENISITGKGVIDMQSVWDEENIRKIVHRGAKAIALKECENVYIDGITVNNCTDLAIYFAGCENVEISNVKMRTYIDGISPDNSKNVKIHDCDIETGDDGIVFKSSYTLNRLDYCKDIRVWNCKVKSRCNAIKFGTETNGGFYDILIENVDIRETRITGIAVESVDGAIIDGVTFRNITMKNVGTPIFVYLGKRMRGPEGRQVGKIKNITFENVTAEGEYVPYEVIEWHHISFVNKDTLQKPWVLNLPDYKGEDLTLTEKDCWQITSNICGLKESPLENITLKNVTLKMDGGCKDNNIEIDETVRDYPEVYVYGRVLPAKGIYFRHVNGLTMENVKIETYREDVREDSVFYKVN